MQKPITLITGAASGIGRSLAERLSHQAYTLLLSDINIDQLTHTFDGQPHALFQHDVSSLADWQALFEQIDQRYGQIDYLFNIAGVITPGYCYETPIEEVDRHIDINVKGVLYGTRLAAERMQTQRSGHIINIASMAGIAPVPGLSLYSASKFAVRGYSLAAAEELRDFGVTISCICPGLVDTPMLDLQLNYDEAALTFSNGHAMTTSYLVDKIEACMRRKPIEMSFPNAWLAKMASAFPSVNRYAKRLMVIRGRSEIAKIKQKHQYDSRN